ncbi:MAG: 6-bladed beta-propeller [Candidatus Aminicenantes bacterium]|nr:6-bladed beta-propeller [Candidatus Aminicenantes bacterium]
MIRRASSAGAIIVSAISLVLNVPACSKKAADTGRKAEVEIVDGIKTVRNPETPRYGEFVFDLVEDLSIGSEDDDAYFFPNYAGVAVDGKGTIFVVDYDNRRVQVYDKQGRYVRTLGRVGQGPGEYRFPSSVMPDAAGNIVINDAARFLLHYSPEGLFQKSITLKTSLSLLMLGPGGTIVGTAPLSPKTEGGPKNKLIQLGPDGEVLMTLAEYPACSVVQNLVIRHWYTCQVSFSLRSADSLYYGFDQDYMVHVVDQEGRPLFAFSKADKPVPISAEEIALTRKEGIFSRERFGEGDPGKTDLGLPGHRPFWSKFVSDKEGRLYVIRFKPITEKDITSSDVDVFSKDGYYLYRMTWPFVPQVIKGGFLYEVRQDEEAGLTKVIRHRIKNWSDFRTE